MTGLAVALAIAASAWPGAPAQAGNLGVAQDYNMFILKDATQSGSDTEGRVAVGGAANFSSYSVGLQVGPDTPNALVSGQSLTFSNGGTVYGDIHHAGSISLSPNVDVKGTVSAGSVIDFGAAATSLIAQSTFLSQQTATGTVVDHFGVFLTGTNASLDVFNLTQQQFADAIGMGLTINAPAGATVLINVAGTSAAMMNYSINLNGPTPGDILYNFYQATSLNLSGISVLGSILAPTADVSFASGQLNGTLIGQSLTGNGQLNYHPFLGNLPTPPPSPTPEPSSIVMLASAFVAGLVSLRRRRLA